MSDEDPFPSKYSLITLILNSDEYELFVLVSSKQSFPLFLYFKSQHLNDSCVIPNSFEIEHKEVSHLFY